MQSSKAAQVANHKIANRKLLQHILFERGMNLNWTELRRLIGINLLEYDNAVIDQWGSEEMTAIDKGLK